jgi:hypothetical protein
LLRRALLLLLLPGLIPALLLRLPTPLRWGIIVVGHQRSRLIRRELLADFACGFGKIGCASGASSHAVFKNLAFSFQPSAFSSISAYASRVGFVSAWQAES